MRNVIIGKIVQEYGSHVGVECRCLQCKKNPKKGHMIDATISFKSGLPLEAHRYIREVIRNADNDKKNIRITIEIVE